MATPRIDRKVPVFLGNCIRVENVEKKLDGGRLASEPDRFVCIQVEEEDGYEEYCILLTELELDRLPRVDASLGGAVQGRAYRRFIGGYNVFCIRLKDWNGGVFTCVFSALKWKECYERALLHPKSCTVKNRIVDFFD